jgi:hypothetical protein
MINKIIIGISMFVVLLFIGTTIIEKKPETVPEPIVEIPSDSIPTPEVVQGKEVPRDIKPSNVSTPKVTAPVVVTPKVEAPTVSPVITPSVIEVEIVPEPEVIPIQKETVYTLTLPVGSPVQQPKDRMCLSELQFFTANLFKVYDSPYSHFLNAPSDEIVAFLQSNGYQVLIEQI